MTEERRDRPAAFHIPVLLEESMEGLKVKGGGRYIDATLGAGGHAEAILEASGPDGRLLGIDRDRQALKLAAAHLDIYRRRVVQRAGNFEDIREIAMEAGWEEVDGIFFDLGVSSMQMDTSSRGFGFRQRARLDMRMDQGQEVSAWDVVNRYPMKELAGIFWELGQERLARPIAAAIVEERRKKPVETTWDLAELVTGVYGRSGGRIHPATRVFQALRIHLNRELDSLRSALPAAVDLLRPGGRLAVISYHSLEDRVVKDGFRFLSGRCLCPAQVPVCVCGAARRLSLVTKRPIRPSSQEVSINRRSRSGRLRVAEKLEEAP